MASFADTADATTTLTSTTSNLVISTTTTSTTDILTTSPTNHTDLTSRLPGWDGEASEGSTCGTDDAEVDPASTEQEAETNCDDQADYDDTEPEEEEAYSSESLYTDSDGESVDPKFEAEAGADDSTKYRWDNETGNAKVEVSGNWNSGSAEVDDFPNDSGYATSPEPVIESPEEITYRGIPFRTKHHFFTYVQRILEDTCFKYARDHLSKDLADPNWKCGAFSTYDTRFHLERFIYLDCLAYDQVELEKWMRILAVSPGKKSKAIFEAVADFRNMIVHREHLSFECLSLAMKLPTLLDDTPHETEISNAFSFIMGDQSLDQDTSTAVEKAIFTPPVCSSHHQLLARIQTLLEETCFRHASATIPHYLESKKWEIPEQVEFPKMQEFMKFWGVQHVHSADTLFPRLTRGSWPDNQIPGYLNDCLYVARDNIRNFAAHRVPLSDEELVHNVHLGIKLCLLMGEWHQAIEIEVLAEMYFTRRSRVQVEWRLRWKFQEGEIESSYEQERRIALRQYFGLTEEESDQDAGVGVEKDENGYWDVSDGSRAYSTDSSSMHSLLKRTVNWGA